MPRIIAIAQLAIRAAIRSRLVLALLVLLLATILGLPAVVRGDGTPEGQARLVVGYTMGISSALLGMALLWAGALSLSREIQEKQLQLAAVKPVRAIEIWLGKALGLALLGGVLLAGASGATYASLRLGSGLRSITPAERGALFSDVLAARRTHRPAPPDVEEAARATLRARMEAGTLPEGLSPAQALAALKQERILQASTVRPGGRLDWSFTMPASRPPGTPRLRYRFNSAQLDQRPVSGQWRAGPADSAPVFTHNVTHVPGSMQTLDLPADAAGGPWTISFVNTDPRAVPLIFPPADGPLLLSPAGSFEANLARATLLIYARLLFLIAAGVTAGALFSTPVAILMSAAMLILLVSSGYVSSLASGAESLSGVDLPAFANTLLRGLYGALNLVLAPLRMDQPFDQAATGIWIAPATVLRTLLVQGILYGGLLAALGSAALNRKELAR